ncbi:hypothetical protein [Pseudomonas sp. NPDC079086]|uniref:hypothetical protein n=1 Tax=unclassified Pseudomonas TaxID=196821 RepID=UPI0037CBA35C
MRRTINFSEYEEAFIQIVLRHIREGMTRKEWRSYRSHAPRIKIRTNPPDFVVRKSFCESGISIEEMLTDCKDQKVVGELNGRDIFFVPSLGLYCHAINSHFIFEVNICCPARLY